MPIENTNSNKQYIDICSSFDYYNVLIHLSTELKIVETLFILHMTEVDHSEVDRQLAVRVRSGLHRPEGLAQQAKQEYIQFVLHSNIAR
jgi:hypothetical protein